MKKKILSIIRRIFATDLLVSIQNQNQTIINAQLFRGIIQDSDWLKYKSFAPGGSAVDNAGLYTLYRILNDMKPNKILEFGLGQSSKMVHQYANYFQNTYALTVEHDPDWTNFFCSGLDKNITTNIIHLDLETISYKEKQTLTYKKIDELDTKSFDFIIIDGPFGSLNYSRSQIINIVKRGLPERFCIYMDDTERKGEQETINEIIDILNLKNIKHHVKKYSGEKMGHTVICSSGLYFLTTLK